MGANTLIDKLLHSEDSSERLDSAITLVREDLLDISNIENFSKGLFDKDDGVKDYISNTLADVKEELREKVAEIVAEIILNTNIEIRNIATDILTKLGHQSAIALRKYVNNEDFDVRKFAIDIIGLTGNNDDLPIILKRIDDDDANVRVSVIEAAGNIILNHVDEIDSYHILKEFEKAYDHDEELRPMIIEVAGKTNSAEGEDFILNVLERTDDEFIRSACIDSLAIGGNSADICDRLLEQLPTSNKQFQLIILRTIYGIAYRLGLEIILPEDLRYIAYNALQDNDEEIRSAGLLALGGEYKIEDIKYLIPLMQNQDFDIHQFIVFNLMSTSEVETVSMFFTHYGEKVISENPIGAELDFYGILSAVWENAIPANKLEATHKLYDYAVKYAKGKSHEIIDLLLKLEKETTMKNLENSLQNGNEDEIFEALDIVEQLRLQEFKNLIKSMNWNNDRLDYKASSIIF